MGYRYNPTLASSPCFAKFLVDRHHFLKEIKGTSAVGEDLTNTNRVGSTKSATTVAFIRHKHNDMKPGHLIKGGAGNLGRGFTQPRTKDQHVSIMNLSLTIFIQNKLDSESL